MPYTKIWIHLVWSTKLRTPLLTRDIRQKLFTHIKENARNKSIYIDFINGYTDHVHCLLALAPEQNVSKVVQLLKGESSFWINRMQLCREKFEWQDEYFAVSVSESGINRLREYIKNQEVHHQKKSFQEECNEFFIKYGFEKLKG